ncbi:tetratricopeptide repeat protein [Aquimarina megaterium]|uniref:tetratricopeptide repeat protein n=1 Tax=Aquimarina megaterium TaxID=1443666 RepID=UPI00046F618D|nr:tetratricopeptide repeat protein [Aquimarina megaterium]
MSRKARNYRISDIKKLFAFSGNQCAKPGCTNPVIAEDQKTVIGQICHISAASPNGPRYNEEMTDEERRSYENLILLCGEHHEIIDNIDNVDDYDTEKLKQWKRDHELHYQATPLEINQEQIEILVKRLSQKQKDPLPIVIFTTLVSVFSGINQIWGFFAKINFFTVITSIIIGVTVLLFFEKFIKKNVTADKFLKIYKISIRKFVLLLSLFIIMFGTIPFTSQFLLAHHYSNKAEDFSYLGLIAKSKNYLTKASSIYNKLGLKEKSNEVTLKLAESFIHLGDMGEADKIISELQKSPNLSLSNQTKLNIVKGNKNRLLGNYIRAEADYQNALQTADTTSIDHATILLNKSVILDGKGPNYKEKSNKLCQKALSIFKIKNDKNALSTTYLNLSARHQSSPEIAMLYLDSAAFYNQERKSPHLNGLILANRGFIFLKKGNILKAKSAYLESLDWFEKTNNIARQSDLEIKLAQVDIAQSKNPDALQRIKQSIALANSISEEGNIVNPIKIANLSVTQATVLEKMGKFKEAEQQYQKALKLLNKHRSYDVELRAMINYSAYLQKQNRRTEASQLLDELYSLLETQDESQSTLAVLNNLAKLHMAGNRLEKSEQQYREALNIAKRLGDRDSEASTMENLAIVLKLSNKPGSQKLLNDALKIYRKLDNQTNVANCLFNIYKLTNQKQALDEMLDFLDSSEIDYDTYATIVLGLTTYEIAKQELLNHKDRIKSILHRYKDIDSIINEVVIGKCHLRLAQIELELGNLHRISKHLEYIDNSFEHFEYFERINIYTQAAFLKAAINDYRSATVNFFDAFDLLSNDIDQQILILGLIERIWSGFDDPIKETYINKLSKLKVETVNPALKNRIDRFISVSS